MKNQKMSYVVFGALFTAMSFVLYLVEFPVIPTLSYLKLDLGDIPALIASVIIGPAMGALVELLKNVIQLLVRGFGSQMGFGNIMNFLVGTAYIVPFALIWRKKAKNGKNKGAVIAAMLVGLVSIVVVGALGNYIIAPLFFKYFLNTVLSKEALLGAVGGATAINLVKGVMLSIVSYPLIKALGKHLNSMIKD